MVISEEKRHVLNKYSDLLNKEIQSCVRADIDFCEIGECRRVVILHCVPISIINKVLDSIKLDNKHVSFVFVGTNKGYEKCCVKDESIFIEHNKRFDENDAELIKNVMKEHQPDGILYFNDYVNGVNYSNIEYLIDEVAGDLPIFCYSYIQGELNKVSNVGIHVAAIAAYKTMVEWFDVSERNNL